LAGVAEEYTEQFGATSGAAAKFLSLKIENALYA